MKKSERDRIKEKILSINPDRWWGDDFDIRFYLISKLKSITNEFVLDVGGGIGIVSSEISDSNTRINLDFSFDELKTCKLKTDNYIQNICGTMTDLPFKDFSFDSVISSSVLQYARNSDVKKNLIIYKNKINEYPSVEKSLSEIHRILKPKGIFLIDFSDGKKLKHNLSNEEIEWLNADHLLYYERFFSDDKKILYTRELIIHKEKGLIKEYIRHKRIYSAEDIIELLKQTGFSRISVSGKLSINSQQNRNTGMMGDRIIITATVIT